MMLIGWCCVLGLYAGEAVPEIWEGEPAGELPDAPVWNVRNGVWRIPEGVDLSRPEWRPVIDAHRVRMRAQSAPVRRPEIIKRSFVEGFAFLYDVNLFDPETRRWKVEEFLARGEAEIHGMRIPATAIGIWKT